MQRVKIILNPTADRGHARERARRLREAVSNAATSAPDDYELDWVFTTAPGNATELAEAAADEGYDIVVAVGGDGTAHEVANGLLRIPTEQRPTMGIIPAGSGNDFAFNIGIPPDPEEAAAYLVSGNIKHVDAATISDNLGRSRFWDNTVGIGFAGAVNATSYRITWLRGFLMYLVAVLYTIIFKPQDLGATMTFDSGEGGEKVVERRIAMLSVNNGPREGGGFPTSPHAVMDDGELSYTIMSAVGRLRMFYFVPIVMNAKHHGYPKFFEPGNAHSVRIVTDKPMGIHVDGESFSVPETGVTEVEMKILPGALRVLAGNLD